MAIEWEVFTQSPNVRIDTIRVSLNKRGLFSLNQKAFESLQNTEKVELLFAKDNKLIGMRPCSPDVAHGLPLKKQGKTKAYIVRGISYCNYHSVKPKKTLVFNEPKVDEDGVLVLNLKKVSEVAMRSPRTKPTVNQYNTSLFEPVE
jgi:hypothetical protein